MSINWTDDLRYQSYESWDPSTIENLKRQAARSNWRFSFHIQPETGLLNDPNGFSYFNNQWHVFYQAYPFGAVHGLKSWYHMYSDNLVDWKRDQVRLLPDTAFDSHGVYSGSALTVGEELFLAYTGNVRDQDWNRAAYQMGAFMDKKFQVTKESIPFIPHPPKGYTHHFRDPQVFKYEDKYYLVIGAQTENEEGKVLLYSGESLSNWTLIDELHFTEEFMGYMIECPNLIFVDSKPILIFCPQGMDKSVSFYQNIYPNMYITADSFDPEQATLQQPSKLQNLDDGFDVYATQAFTAPDGRTLAIGWVGLPDVTYPSDKENWAHCLTLVRELRMIDNKLHQLPVVEQEQLRQEGTSFHPSNHLSQRLTSVDENSYECEMIIPEGQQGVLTLCANEKTGLGFEIHIDSKNGKIEVNRENMPESVNSEFGTTRCVDMTANKPIHLRLFIDHSICELFVNHGEKVLTSRIFPKNEDTAIYTQGLNAEMTLWPIRPMLSNRE